MGSGIELVFRFQTLFNAIISDHVLVKKWKNEKSYIILKPRSEVRKFDMGELKEIEIDKEQAELLNDIVYYFNHVKIGKGLLFSMYHGAEEKTNKYSLGGIIMDENHPERILWRSEKPIITPELWWETDGGSKKAEVPNVVFTCNLIPWEGKFITYHSGADKYLGRTDLEIEIK